MRFFGKIGYLETVDTGNGVWAEKITEREYFGDVTRNTKRNESGEHLNDNIAISNTISIVADEYAFEHFLEIKFVEWAGAKWKISNVELQSPRLILSIGGVYNAPEE